jgi:hypothetical protein
MERITWRVASWEQGLTLTTHAIVGAAIASLLPTHPYLAVSAAFASHFLLDAIPHWDYPLRSDSMNPGVVAAMKFDSAVLADVLTIGADAMLGLGLALLLLARPGDFALIICGAGAAILPDALQFAYMRFPREPLISLQRFHCWIHASRNLSGRPVLGLSAQISLVVFVLLIVRVLPHFDVF